MFELKYAPKHLPVPGTSTGQFSNLIGGCILTARPPLQKRNLSEPALTSTRGLACGDDWDNPISIIWILRLLCEESGFVSLGFVSSI